MISLVLKCGTVLLDLLKGFYSISKLLNDPVILKSRLGQCVLWDCFGNAIASFIGYYHEVALKTGSEEAICMMTSIGLTTTTTILQGFSLLCKLGLLLFKPRWDSQIEI